MFMLCTNFIFFHITAVNENQGSLIMKIMSNILHGLNMCSIFFVQQFSFVSSDWLDYDPDMLWSVFHEISQTIVIISP